MNNEEFIERLKRKGIKVGKPITIAPTPENLRRHEEVYDFIKSVEEAHERTKYSKLRFDYRSAS